jgi:sn-glycerol 3-phosphate transport system substrate-binding protein
LEVYPLFTEPENQARWSVATGFIAAVYSALETEEMKNYFETIPQASVMYDQLNYAFQQTSVFASAEIGEIFQNMFTSVVTGEATIEDAVSYAQSEADYILSDYR